MIELKALTKVYGKTVAVDAVSFEVRPGVVTGFLGPNGAGKSTSMRIIVGLTRPTSGEALVNGRPYRDLRAPLREVGTLLEARAVHTSRSARNHLLAMAATHGLPRSRVDKVIDLVGLSGVATGRAGEFSLGMGQRLGIAAALLGDPGTLILDEPGNGLDPDGIRWVRTLLRQLASEGRTVFVSSHLMSEMALTADHLVVVGRGRLLADVGINDFIRANTSSTVRVTTHAAAQLAQLLARDGVTISRTGPDNLEVVGLPAADIGNAAAQAGIVLHDLSTSEASLEDAFMLMTHSSTEYHGSTSSTRTSSSEGTGS